MGWDKLNEYHHPPASVFSLQEPERLGLSVSKNGAADYGGISFATNSFGPDLFSFRHVSLPIAHPPLQKMNTDQSYIQVPESDDKSIAGSWNLNSLQNLQIDPCSDNARGNVTKHLRVSDVTNSEGEPVEICQSIEDSDIFTMNPLNVGIVCSSGVENPVICMNIMPPGSNTDGGNQMARQGRETESKSVSRLPISRNSLSLGHSTSAMHQAKDLGQKGSTYDVNFCYDQLGFSEQFDGSFLTLGTGSNQEPSSKKQFSTREITTKLEEAVQPQSKHAHIQRSTRNPPSVTHNRDGNMSSLQSNANGSSSLAYNAGGWTFSCNNDEVIHGANTGLSSRPLYLQRSQADTQHGSTVTSYGDSGYVGNTSVRFSDIFPPRGIQGDQDPISLPFNSNSTYVSHSGSTELSGFASASANPPWITPQPFPNYLQNSYTTNNPAWITPQPVPNHLQYSYIQNDINTSTESSIGFRLPRLRRSSISQHHIGNLIPPSEGSAIHAFDSHAYLINTQAVGQLASAPKVDSVQALHSSVPGRIQGSVTGVGSLQPSTDASFPRRLGVRPNDAAAQAVSEGKKPETQSFTRVQLSGNLDGPAFALGQIQGSLPVQNSHNLPRADHTNGQVIHMAKVDASQATSTLSRPPVKRRATAPPSVASRCQRRKITPPSISEHLASYLRRSVPASSPIPVPPVATSPVPVPSPAPRSIQVPPAPLYIKSQGIEGPPQPLGHRCLICKRDLSYTPEGPFYQPAVPPPVAILSCGHTFHDHCLQIITPDEQSKDPPCIPCAIGET